MNSLHARAKNSKDMNKKSENKIATVLSNGRIRKF